VNKRQKIKEILLAGMKYTVETLLKLKNSPLSVKPDSLTDTWVKPKRKKKNVPEWMDFDPSLQQDDMEMFSKQK
jgi:hypothetical protein